MCSNPLVSIIVLTFNSANTIEETLDSIYRQSYKNIELIITDDASTDDTLLVCKDWINRFQDRFDDVRLIMSNVNTGIASNMNRGCNDAKGIWLKPIAGDDILLEDCIELNLKHSDAHPDAEMIFSKLNLIGSQNLINRYCKSFKYGFFDLTHNESYVLLLTSNYIFAPTSFFKKSVFCELKGFDERMPLLEDWPFWIKAYSAKKIISFNKNSTVAYRLSDRSVSLSEDVSPLYQYSLDVFNYSFLPEYQKKKSILLFLYYRTVLTFKQQRFLYKSLILLNPYSYYIKYLKYKMNRNNVII